MRPVLLLLLLAASPCVPGSLVAGETEGVRALERGDFTVAAREFAALAAAGDAKAMTQLGLLYYEGQGVERDQAKAMDWFLKARDREPDALVCLGVMHRDGLAAPKNAKMAYAVFVAVRASGAGGEETQGRVSSLLRRITPELSVEDLKDCLANYTLAYVDAYLAAKGVMNGVPEHLKPSPDRPALKDLGLWQAGQLDVLFGKAPLAAVTGKEAQTRVRRREEAEARKNRHALVLQAMCSGLGLDSFRACVLVADDGPRPLAFSANTAASAGSASVHDARAVISTSTRRVLALEDAGGARHLVYELGLPAVPVPCGWSDWLAPSYALGEAYELFGLSDGREPAGKLKDVPADAPRVRFRVERAP